MPTPTDILRTMFSVIGEDASRDGLRETPARAVRAWQHWLSGYACDPGDVLKAFEHDNNLNVNQMVFQANIPFWSTCEHHLAPFWGVAHIGYIPQQHVVGLSKLTRLVDLFARRLTIQERITRQVADAIHSYVPDVSGVGVMLQARHSCMESRGVQKAGIITMTTVLRGDMMREPETRAEFMALAQMAAGAVKSL